MRAAIDDLGVARATVGQLDVGELSVGPLSVGSLVLDTTHLDVSTGQASFRDLRITISLTMTIDWEVSVSIPLVGTFGFDGTIDLGTQSVALGLGDVAVPGLQALSLDLPASRWTTCPRSSDRSATCTSVRWSPRTSGPEGWWRPFPTSRSSGLDLRTRVQRYAILASANAQQGDLEGACAVGRQALVEMGRLRSKRTFDDVARLVEVVGANRSQTTDDFIKDAREVLKSR